MYVVISGGDLVLVVGPEQRCIQVSVDLLRTSSPVFDDMISSGLIKTSDGVQGTMELPDDNALALLHALKILYGADPVMGQLTTKEIQEVAVLVDKYRMAPRFQFIGTFWMRSVPVDNEECWHLMTAAFWLRLRCSFFEMSKELARARDHMLFKYANETPDKVLGLRLGMAIQQLQIEGGSMEMGLCLDCFLNADENLIEPRPNCDFPDRHL
ncbi:hypothetical protein FSOLCH5_008904 [Fusarium solani]|uniref:BTB domain-containing protein n=1 Tax=Fusarium solani TaxID=169388 RepID=A0A9P9G8X6_FUSSL|nr:uncharacterized protein B0J15DRAFT_407125 [Fusarium solani]KAH7235173.1 hypothetical protein B0J15DRAFT_407125 [Fusarium solani]KAJ3464593.1 hypothetical protein MRS44_009379 [Fusarium solani]